MSGAVHVALLCGLGPALAPERGTSLRAQPAATPQGELAFEVALADGAESVADAASPWRGEGSPDVKILPAPRSGGDRTPRPDDRRSGRGGSDEAASPASNLAARDDQILRSPALQSRFDRSQTPRRRNGEVRASPEDDGVTPAPMIVTFVADGAAKQALVSAASRAKLPRGAPVSPAPQLRTPRNEGDSMRLPRPAADPRATATAEPPLARPATASSFARPSLRAGRDSAPSNERGPERDTVDAEQEVHTTEPSLLNASAAGGKLGQGPGGQSGPGPTGSGDERGPGSTAQALGDGAGPGNALDPADARRTSYVRSVWLKIQNNWSAGDFPRDAALMGRQGYTILGFAIDRSGRVFGVRVVRPSGYEEFDRRMTAAVLRAAPFGPLPAELGPALLQTHEFVVSNPAVR